MSGYTKHPTRYGFAAHNFGSGDATRYIKGPKGKGGRLVDYGIHNITTTFNAVSTEAKMRVGISGSTAKHGADISFGTIAATDGGKSVLTETTPGSAAYNALIVDRVLAPDTMIFVTLTAMTGGSPAGVATAFVDIIWDD